MTLSGGKSRKKYQKLLWMFLRSFLMTEPSVHLADRAPSRPADRHLKMFRRAIIFDHGLRCPFFRFFPGWNYINLCTAKHCGSPHRMTESFGPSRWIISHCSFLKALTTTISVIKAHVWSISHAVIESKVTISMPTDDRVGNRATEEPQTLFAKGELVSAR